MHASTLICTHDGIERPAPGPWTIAAGWPVALTWRSGLRVVHCEARTTGGRLAVPALHDDDRDPSHPGGLALELAVDLAPAAASLAVQPAGMAGAILLRTRRLEPTDHGSWQVDAEVDSYSGLAVVDAEVRYLGVFRVGDAAVARLVVRARLARSGGDACRLSRVVTGTRVDLVTDLHAAAPAALLPTR
jgi:hypothetical protein